MYPSRFRYEAPRSLDEAIALLHDGGDYAKVLAGGQSLVPLMKLRFASPELIVDINDLPGLDYHRADPDGTLRIGALCRHADLERSDLLTSTQPTMAAAAPADRRPHRAQPRHAGRLALPRRPAGRLGIGGARRSAARSWPRDPGAAAPSRSPTSSPGRSRTCSSRTRSRSRRSSRRRQGTRAGGYLKLERRVGDFATAGVAVAIETSGETVTRAGIALTGVGGSTIAATEAAGALIGEPLTADRIAQAADLAAAAARPRTDHRGSAEFKRHIVRTFVVRILTRAAGQTRRRKGRPDMTIVYDDHDDDTSDVPVRRIKFTINGAKKVAEVEPRLLLSHLIRRGVGLTGTHMGCDTTNCGACTVLVDGQAVKSCTMLAVQADGREITTVEGLATASELHPLQEGFRDEHGLQCGFCTPGMMMAAKALLDSNPDPTEEDVRWALSGNLCRCTGYQNIVKSVLWAADKLRSQSAG